MGTGGEAAAAMANAVAMTVLLWGERRRLPMQNVAALGCIAAALGVGSEWGMARALGTGSSSWVQWAMCWPVTWLGARVLARMITPTGGPLAVHTMAFGSLLLPGVGDAAWRMAEQGWPGVGLAAARLGSMLLGLLALAPWWIRKPLSAPRPVPSFSGGLAILAALVSAVVAPGVPAAPDWARVVSLAGPLAAAAWLWVRRRRPTGRMGRNGRMS